MNAEMMKQVSVKVNPRYYVKYRGLGVEGRCMKNVLNGIKDGDIKLIG